MNLFRGVPVYILSEIRHFENSHFEIVIDNYKCRRMLLKIACDGIWNCQ